MGCTGTFITIDSILEQVSVVDIPGAIDKYMQAAEDQDGADSSMLVLACSVRGESWPMLDFAPQNINTSEHLLLYMPCTLLA